MARKSSVRYWQSRGAYCAWVRGIQHTLAVGPDDFPDGPTYTAAAKKWAALMHEGDGKSATLSEVCDQHISWLAGMREASTVKIKTESLRRVCASFGGRVACSLTPLEVEKWSATEALRRGWNAGTVRLTLKGLLSCLRWAAKHNVIPSNPLTALEMPGAQSRGREVVLTPEQETTVLAAARGRNLALVVFLRETGCRPSEVSVIEAQHFKPERRAIVIPPRSADGKANHKTASTGKDRTIYLTGAAQAVVEQLAARFPSGPLFRCQQSPRDRRPGKRSVALSYCAIRNVMTRLSAKTGIKGLIAYSFRHTFAVRWLRAGKPVEALAELLGTSPKMIHDHYGHLAAQTDYLRRLADDFGAARDSAG